MESTESRYTHLLQPIRELTKNWEIDLASELNDYLEELDDMCITFDGGKTRLNFSEAALLIQGSACIYSKKVELLHSLVFQTLEYINDKNKKRNKQGAESKEGDGRAASSHDAADTDEFSELDPDVSDRSEKCDSKMAVNVVPLPPESLIAPETHEKQKLPLISVKGEILCCQKDFKINLFLPSEGDMILLMLTSEPGSRFRLHGDPTETRHPDAVAPADAVGGADAEDDFLPIEAENMEQEEQEEHVDRLQMAPSDGQMVRERRQLEAGRPRREDLLAAVSVWALHDPYSELGDDKPLKAGKCYRVPDGLEDGGKRKRKRAASLQDFRSWFRGTFDPPEHKLKNGPTFTDLNYVYLSTVKNKVKTQKRINRRAGVVISEEELRRTFLQPEEAGPQQLGAEPVEELQQDLLGADDDTSDNERDAFPDDVPAEFVGGADLIFPEGDRDELSYEDLVKLRVEQLVVSSRGYNQETALSRRVKDWEEKIGPELVLQEERPAFDIHDYGDRITRALRGVGCRRSLASIVHGLDNFEASKYLLASLQLANDCTVEIDCGSGLEDGLDTMGLTLLSMHRATDRFHTLTAST